MICHSSHFLPCDHTPGVNKVVLQFRKKGFSGYTPAPLRTVWLPGNSCLFVPFLSAYDVLLVGRFWIVGCGSWTLLSGDERSEHLSPLPRGLCPPPRSAAQQSCSRPAWPPRAGPSASERGDLSSYPQLALLPESYGLCFFSFLKPFCFGCCRSFAQSWLSLRPHGLRRARLPCPSPPPGASLKLMSRCLLRLCVEV